MQNTLICELECVRSLQFNGHIENEGVIKVTGRHEHYLVLLSDLHCHSLVSFCKCDFSYSYATVDLQRRAVPLQ